MQERHLSYADLEGDVGVGPDHGADIGHAPPEFQGLARAHRGAGQGREGAFLYGRGDLERRITGPLPAHRSGGEKERPAFAGAREIAAKDACALGLRTGCGGIGPDRKNRIDTGVGNGGEPLARA